MSDDAGSGPAAADVTTPTVCPRRLHGPLPTDVGGLPDLPDGYQRILDAGLRAGFEAMRRDGLDSNAAGVSLSPADRQRIDDHVRLLLAWTAAINLTGIREPEAVAREHVLDSLTAVPILRERRIRRFVDLGSGGGYPGIPLAVALPAERALLVESIAKKAAFLRTVVTALGLGGHVAIAATRAETLAADRRQRGAWPAVVARAVAGLEELVELALPLLAVGGVLVAWKRLPVDREVDRAGGTLRALGGRIIEVRAVHVAGLEDHGLVVVGKDRPTPRTYPRSPTERRRRQDPAGAHGAPAPSRLLR